MNLFEHQGSQMEKTKFIVQLYATRCVPGIYTSLDFCVWAWKICCLLEGSRNESVVAVVYLQCKKNWSKGKQMLVELLLRGRNSRKRFRFSILRFVVHTFKHLLGNPTIGNSALGGGTTLLRFVVLSTMMMFWLHQLGMYPPLVLFQMIHLWITSCQFQNSCSMMMQGWSISF